MRIFFFPRKFWSQLGRLFSTTTEAVSQQAAKGKNKFFGDGVEFFRNSLHKDNLPYAGFSAGCIYLLARGYRLENRVDDIDKKLDKIDEKFDRIDEKFDKLDEKLDRQFSIIMAFVAVKNLPDEIAKSFEKKDRNGKNVVEAKDNDAKDAANK